MRNNELTIEKLLTDYVTWSLTANQNREIIKDDSMRNLQKNLKATVKIGGEILNSKPDELTVEMLANSFLIVAHGIKEKYPSTGAHSGHISRLKKLLSWSIARGQLAVDQERLVDAGYPTVQDFLGPDDNWDAQTLSRRLFSVGVVSEKAIEEITSRDFEQLVEWLDFDNERKKTASTVFLRAWTRLSKIRPLKQLTNSARITPKERYGITIEELPEPLKIEVLQAIETLKTPAYKAKYGEKALSDSSVHIFKATLLQFIGFLARYKKEVLAGKTLQSFTTMNNIIEYLEFSNERSKSTVEECKPLDQKGNKTFSSSQRAYIVQFKRLAKRYLRDEDMHRKLCVLDGKIHSLVESRREVFKDLDPLDNWWKVSHLLLEKSDAPDARPKERAQLRRDALIFALLGLFAYRREVLEAIRLDQLALENGCSVIQIDRDKTKPKSRDLWHEIPQGLTFLMQHYLQVERPVLLGQKVDCGKLLLTKNGAPLQERSISTLVKRHTDRLTKRSNVHQSRDSWATDFLDWTNGDYVTASAVLDSSPETLEQHYNKAQAADLVHKKYDPARSKARERAIQKNHRGQTHDTIY